MRFDWIKIALTGATYARALQNAAQRAGRDVSALQPALSNIAAQPQAKLKPGLSQFVRERGALQPTAQQQDMQKMLARVPWAGAEHGGNQYAEQHLNAMLRRRGLDVQQPGVGEQIARTFGLPRRAPEDPVTRKVPYKGQGPNPFALMDDYKVPGKLPMPDQGTRVGPAPAPSPGQRGRAERAPPYVRGMRDETMIVGPNRPLWERITNPIQGGAVPPPSLRAPSPLRGAGPSGGPQEATAVLKAGSALPIAAGVGIPLAVGGGLLLSKPGIQSNVKNLFSDKGSTQEQDLGGQLPAPALAHADKIHQTLLERGIDPATLRLGIDAPPGSGKTTLARAIAQRAGMKHHGLDWEPGNWWKSTIGLGRNVEKMPRAPKAGEILEHYMLGRTYDPELFDAMIHIRRDPEVIRQQLRSRGNAAYISDMMDLDKSLGVAGKAFDTLGGDVIDIGDGVQLKLRPREGWGNALDQQLMQAGIDPTGLSRHEKLLSLHEGKRSTGAGWTPYVKNPLSTGETLALGASVPLGIMAAKALAGRTAPGV